MAGSVESVMLDKWKASAATLAQVAGDHAFVSDAPLLNEDQTTELDFPLLEVFPGPIQTEKFVNEGSSTIEQLYTVRIQDAEREVGRQAMKKAYALYARLGATSATGYTGPWDWDQGRILNMQPVGGPAERENEDDGTWFVIRVFRTTYDRVS